MGLIPPLIGLSPDPFELLRVRDATNTKFGSISYDTNSDFGGANGQMLIAPDGDLKVSIGGSLAGTSSIFFRSQDGNNKNLRVIFRADKAGGQCGFEVGEGALSTGFFRYDGTLDELLLATTPSAGMQCVLVNSANRSRGQGIAIQTDPAFAYKSGLNPNIDRGETLLGNFKGFFSGLMDNADPLLASRSMETDRATFDSYHTAVHAYQSGGANTNTDGGDRINEAGDANLLDTTTGDGGDVIDKPGEGNSNGRHGRKILKRRGLTKFDGSIVYQNEEATTDATVTTIETIATTIATVVHVNATVSTIEDDGSQAGTYVRMGAFKNDGGVLTQIGATNNIFTATDLATGGVTLTTSGTNILVRVQGELATNLQWSSETTINVTNA